MVRRRAGLIALFGAVCLAFLVDPVAAQGSADTATEELIWGLNQWLLFLAVPIAVLVQGILLYTVLRFRTNDEPLPTRENRRLEITWTAATAIVLLAVGVGSYFVLASPWVAGPANADLPAEGEPVELTVVAEQFSWSAEYPEDTVTELSEANGTVTNAGTVVVPTDRPVIINVTSRDVLHSFHVPDLGLKQDAFPGTTHTLRTVFNTEGTFQLYCAEFCGTGHSAMLGSVEVLDEEEFGEWLSEQAG